MDIIIKDVISTNIAAKYVDGVLVRQRYIDGDTLDFSGVSIITYDFIRGMLSGINTPIQVANIDKDYMELLWLYLANGLHNKY